MLEIASMLEKAERLQEDSDAFGYRLIAEELNVSNVMARHLRFILKYKPELTQWLVGESATDSSTDEPSSKGGHWKETRERDTWVIECHDSRISTVDDAIAKASVNLDIWEVERVIVNG